MRLYNYLNEKRQEAPKIRKYYEKFNRKLFDGKLPEDISITWMNSKKKIGTSQATRDNTTGEVNIKALSISKNFEMTEDQLKGIIVHEMAHLYIMQEIDFREKHGPRFKALIQNLERKVDFDVPETESTILQQLQSSMKPVPIIIGQTNRGKYLAIAIADKTWNEKKDEVLKDADRFTFTDDSFLYGKVSDEIVEQIPKQRKTQRLKAYQIDKEEYERIKSKLQSK